MSDINPIAVAHYDLVNGVCEYPVAGETQTHQPEFHPSFLASIPVLPKAIPGTNLGNSLLTRSSRAPLPEQFARIDALNAAISHEITQPSTIALAMVAPLALGKVRQLGTLAQVEMEAGLSTVFARPSLVRGGAALMSVGVAACSAAPEGGDYTSADASTPPPNTDVTCDNMYDRINGATSDPSLAALVQSIQFPTLDVTWDGNGGAAFEANSDGDVIATITPNTPVAWVKKGDKLFVLTANKDGNTYAPATLFVYALNSNNTLASSEPLPTIQMNKKALLLDNFAPTNMAEISLDSAEWLGITFGAPGGNKTFLLDPSGPFNPAYNPDVKPDYCALKDYPGTDGGSPDAGGHD